MPASEKSVFIADIVPGNRVEGLFLCKKKNEFVGKTGQSYLSMTLGDRSGDADAKVWDNVDNLTRRFAEGDFLWIQAQAITFNNQLQLRIATLRKVDENEVDPMLFLADGGKDTGEMLERLKAIHAGLDDPDIVSLLQMTLEDEEIARKFKLAPAAKAIHHSYLGGLLEHTLSLAELAQKVCDHYPQVDRSMLQAGILFHDIGKIDELEYTRSFGYSDEGRLIGHMTLGIERLNRILDRFPEDKPFPRLKKMVLTHIILAHHGQLEFGSPKRPKTVEAMVLAALDDMDARIFSFQSILDAETRQGRWSTYKRLYDRYLFRWKGEENQDDSAFSQTPPPNEEPGEERDKEREPKSKPQPFQNAIRGLDKMQDTFKKK